MIVNGKDYDLKSLVNDLDTVSNSYVKVGKLMLTKREVEILNRNHIAYKTANSLKDLRIKIEEAMEGSGLDEDYSYDLEYVLESICERDYYDYKSH